MFDDVLINPEELTCLTQEEKNILEKGEEGDNRLYFQTKSLDNFLTCFEITGGKIFQLKRGEMSRFRSDISGYDIVIYNYFDYEDKVVDCELKLHIKNGEIQEITKKVFEIKNRPVFKLPKYENKFGYEILMFFYEIFSQITISIRKMAIKRRILIDDEE